MKSSPVVAASSRERFYPVIFLAATILVYLIPASRAILDDGDALYAHIAQQMNARGDWVTPYANGVRFLDKPPLMFWMMATSYRVLGVHEWSARLPTALGIAGTAWLLWLMGRRAAGARAGLFVALAFVLSAGTLFFTLEAFPDIFLVFFLTLSVYCLLRYYDNSGEDARWAAGFAAAVGGAVLAKSLIGIAFPLTIAVGFIVLTKPRRRLRASHVLLGLAVFTAIAVPWHLLAARANSGFLRHYFINEQLLRFLGRRQPVDYGSIPIPIFWLLILVWLFPWSAFTGAIVSLGKSSGSEDRQNLVVRLALIWAGVVIVFFTFASRLEHYSFPAIPPLALLIGIALSSKSEKVSRWVDRGFMALFWLGVVCGIVAVVASIWWWTTGAALLAGTEDVGRAQSYTNLFSPLFDLPLATRARLISPLIATMLVLLAGTAVAWWWNRRGRRMRAVIALSVTMAVFSLTAVYSLGLCEGLLSSKAFGEAINQRESRDDKVAVVGDYESANSIQFYAQVKLLLLGGSAASIEHGLHYPDAPQMMISRERLEGMWQGPERMYIVGRSAEVGGLGVNPMFVISNFGGRRLISNRP